MSKLTKEETVALMLAHAQAAADLDNALVEQLRGMKLDVALQSLVHIRHRHDQVAAFIGALMPPVVREHKKPILDEACSNRTSPAS